MVQMGPSAGVLLFLFTSTKPLSPTVPPPARTPELQVKSRKKGKQARTPLVAAAGPPNWADATT